MGPLKSTKKQRLMSNILAFAGTAILFSAIVWDFAGQL